MRSGDAIRIAAVCLILAPGPLLAQGTITNLTASPGTITFNSPDPDSTPANGSSSATVIWTMRGNRLGTWSVSVKAGAATLGNCPAVPVSAIKVQCLTLSPENAGVGACVTGSFALSTTGQTIATGTREGTAGVTTMTLSFTFTDSWQYPASSSCSAQITYTVTAQ
jgi:hypothetical protein